MSTNFFAQCKGHYLDLLKYFFPMCSQLWLHVGKAAPDPFRGDSKKDGARLSKTFNEDGKIFFNQNIWGQDSPCVTFFNLMLYTGIASTPRDFFLKVGQFLEIPEYCGKEKRLSKEEWIARQKQLEIKRLEMEKQEAIRVEQESEKARAENLKIWKDTIPLFKNGQPNVEAKEVWKYFQSRGLLGLKNTNPNFLRNLRCYKQLDYIENGKTIGRYDALVCRVINEDGYGLNLHRTYLKEGNKAIVECPKKLTPADRRVKTKARFIPIGAPVNGIIGIAEGVETALSCYLATGIGCYSCVNAQNIKNFVLPQGCHTVLIFADKDRSGVGENAAKELVERLKNEHGVQGSVVLPKMEIPENDRGIDWNDVLRCYGISQFPNTSKVISYIRRHMPKA